MTQPPNLATQAYLAIEERIVTLQLEPGSIISERKLIEVTKMGRTPLREAMQRLSWEGLIEVRPRSGIKIADIRAEDCSKVIELRKVLEPRLARAAARFATPRQLEDVRISQQMMQDALPDLDAELYLKADKAFDQAMTSACENQYLNNILGPLQTHARRFWYRYFSRDSMRRLGEGHIAVMDAVLAREDVRAFQTMETLMGVMAIHAQALKD
ncbi:GntR family transcriptional regulator [Aliiroseovarius lamellibrachiae]|uniref:GntR family transcriptional regulator n=1 Tax=Aliiroseovarius lamellibrachiae TaxID=1924933 RepID=UPI001BDF96CE|nr:GntR family transcriptional regulator [Aliiroseovarius lamellibrachiae]MBT2131931.1 GntR family transcriptional regulator [Aliiroseovarius lamellibrachiae]